MNRRSFLARTAAGGLVLAAGPGALSHALAAAAPQVLTVTTRTLDIGGKAATVFGLVDQAGKPGLRYRAGDDFNVSLRNTTAEATIVHWHGLTPPWPSDGVADAPQPLIGAGGSRDFAFPVGRPGTYWMHAHTLQEQTLLAAPLIVTDPAEDGLDEQEVVILLHDFSFTPAEELLARLNKGSAPMDMGSGDMSGMSMSGGTMGAMSMSGGGSMDMNMSMDINDLEFDAYLANDRTLDDPQVVAVERGGRVRLRIINGGAATAFSIDTGTIQASLVAVDGQNVVPVAGTRFPLTMGQRIDLRLTITDAGAFPIYALREGAPEQTGVILATPGAAVGKLPTSAAVAGPVLDLGLEAKLAALSPMAAKPADRSVAMTLSGDMAAYRWAIATDAPILAELGQRFEVTMTNASMMAHPMHLHGHHFQVVGIDGQRFAGAVRDTVLVPPMRSVTIAVDADNAGQWAFHCHHLYHMVSGMMSTFGYVT